MGTFGGQARERSDAELLAAHVAGDRYAFEELFYRHHRQLYRIARITSRNPDDAADALQDAMLKAHRRAPAFRYDAAVRSWLYRIVVNLSIDAIRRKDAGPPGGVVKAFLLELEAALRVRDQRSGLVN